MKNVNARSIFSWLTVDGWRLTVGGSSPLGVRGEYRHSTVFSLFFMLAVLFLIPNFSDAQTSRTKEFKKEYSGKSRVKVSHRGGPLIVKKSEDGKVRAHAKIMVAAKDEETIDAVLERFQLDDDRGGSTLDLNLRLKTKNWITVNGVIKLEFEDGMKVKGIKKIETEFTLWIPDLEALDLKNKYSEITVEPNIKGHLNVEMHSGKFYAQDVEGELHLDMKYSKAYVKNIADASLELYNTDLEAGNAKNVSVNCKYSDIKLGNLHKLTMDQHDGKLKTGNATDVKIDTKYADLELRNMSSLDLTQHDGNFFGGNIDGNFSIADKYSEIKIGTFKSGKIEMHDGEFKAESGQSLDVKSKYSEFELNKLDNLDFESSHDDKAEVESIVNFSAASKYSEYDFKTLTGSIQVTESHDDRVTVKNLGANFEKIEVEGKYTDLEIENTDAKYWLDVLMTHGKVEYEEDDFENQYYKQLHSKIEIRGKVKGATDNSGKIKVRGFNNIVKLD